MLKIEKSKIVFSLLLLTLLLFLGIYYAMTFGDAEENGLEPKDIPVPELEDEQKQYESKLEALEALKEERERTAPSLYPEHMVDEKGYFNPDYMVYEKQRIIDSIYGQDSTTPKLRKYEPLLSDRKGNQGAQQIQRDTLMEEAVSERVTKAKELGLEHQLFFASDPLTQTYLNNAGTDTELLVRVDGTQTVRNNFRLNMRLVHEVKIHGKVYPKNLPVYGFISFKPNRTLVTILHLGQKPISLTAYDYQDRSEGIYIENNFRAQVSQEVIGDVVDDINIAGVPQVSGVKKIFKNNHRSPKVTVQDNYLILLAYQ